MNNNDNTLLQSFQSNCSLNESSKQNTWWNLVSILKSWLPEKNVTLSEVNQKQKTSELIMGELSWQMKMADQRRIEKEREEKMEKTGVDYSWLVSYKQKPTCISEFKRYELEELCYQIEPDECTEVIRSFWMQTDSRKWQADEYPDILRSILLSNIHNRSLINSHHMHNNNTFLNLQKWTAISFTNMFWGSEDGNTTSSQELSSSYSLEMVEMGVDARAI